MRNATIKAGYTQGKEQKEGNVRIHSERWKGNSTRPLRDVQFLDLSRIVPISGRVGYAKIAKSSHIEASAESFDDDRLERLSNILGHKYVTAKMALADVDLERRIPVLQRASTSYSGYHQARVKQLLQS